MLNLLWLPDIADYCSYPELVPTEPISGGEAYLRYMQHTEPFLVNGPLHVSLRGWAHLRSKAASPLGPGRAIRCKDCVESIALNGVCCASRRRCS